MKMKLANPLRFIFAFLGCSVMAVALAAQTISVVFTQKDPVTAIKLFPLNGVALEQVSSEVFSSIVSTGAEPAHSASLSEQAALAAYQQEPLAPEAHVILALAQQYEVKKSRVVEIASQLNRRESSLQALVLQEYVQAKDFANSVKTLDEILRVRPARYSDLFPLLLSVFANDGAVTEFAKVLDGSSPWHRKFINFALNDPAAVQSLYRLRSLKPFDPDQDRKLIERLAGAGELESAYQLYEQVSEAEEAAPRDRKLSWSSDNPPFDWWFVDDADFRAQPSLGSDDLEVYARAGQGGGIARRIIRTPSVPFSLNLTHSLSPRTASEDVRLSLQCVDSRKPVAEQAFGASAVSLRVEDLPPDCDFLEIAVTGRVWTGQSTLRGDISPIALR